MIIINNNHAQNLFRITYYLFSSYNYKSNSSEPKESYEFADLY